MCENVLIIKMTFSGTKRNQNLIINLFCSWLAFVQLLIIFNEFIINATGVFMHLGTVAHTNFAAAGC